MTLTCLRMNRMTGEKNLIFWSLYYIEILKFRLIGGMQRNYLFSMLDKNLTIELSISTSCCVVIHVLVPVSVEGVGSISTHCYTSFSFKVSGICVNSQVPMSDRNQPRNQVHLQVSCGPLSTNRVLLLNQTFTTIVLNVFVGFIVFSPRRSLKRQWCLPSYTIWKSL